MVYAEPNNTSELTEALQGGGKQLVYLTATWCGPCRQIAPHFTKASDDAANASIKFFKVDIDKCNDHPIVKDVTGVPTFIALHNGTQIDVFSGANLTRLNTLVAKLVAA
ncbi:hypothetical protein SAMD00019534_075390 [Acytostelium subglobosum LB1]|uniref:hypothetical protein n=1 Tax=Acytostelium subglobosum LB1 TaxID=1410327 RepID=UPI000644E6BC|nr:hypothetical protein SAMD00019534_075390 [Acytostelium subglobosum LB1]GAM24364.1 hypothetical protein SAMD00019534_075390 [Acytostelium subglobosum LB1]|eukprot:XP_012752690.1 hypothetical protein SAMD00019534_075390 [Acytostelium subglobosum LB1]